MEKGPLAAAGSATRGRLRPSAPPLGEKTSLSQRRSLYHNEFTQTICQGQGHLVIMRNGLDPADMHRPLEWCLRAQPAVRVNRDAGIE